MASYYDVTEDWKGRLIIAVLMLGCGLGFLYLF